MMSTRFMHREIDGDSSDKTSALEMAIDSHWYDGISSLCVDAKFVLCSTIFLSSTEAQDGNLQFTSLECMIADFRIVVNDLWRGKIVQKHNEDHDIECKASY